MFRKEVTLEKAPRKLYLSFSELTLEAVKVFTGNDECTSFEPALAGREVTVIDIDEDQFRALLRPASLELFANYNLHSSPHKSHLLSIVNFSLSFLFICMKNNLFLLTSLYWNVKYCCVIGFVFTSNKLTIYYYSTESSAVEEKLRFYILSGTIRLWKTSIVEKVLEQCFLTFSMILTIRSPTLSKNVFQFYCGILL